MNLHQETPNAAVYAAAANSHFVLCGWLLLSKTFMMQFMFVRSGLVSGLLARLT